MCLFCKIAAGQIESEIVHRDEKLFVLRDVAPQAPEHVLVIPVDHYQDLVEVTQADPQLVALLVAECARQGSRLGAGNGFRVVVNTGSHGGQTVPHLHFHVLAGRALQWPPG